MCMLSEMIVFPTNKFVTENFRCKLEMGKILKMLSELPEQRTLKRTLKGHGRCEYAPGPGQV